MFKKILVALALVASIFVMVACSTSNAQKTENLSPTTAAISITNQDEFNQNPHIQKQINVAKGDQIKVTLVSNASTGFSWNENAVIADVSIVQQVNHQSIASNSNVVGAAGSEEWAFKVMKTGTTTIHLEYGRPWEGGEKGVWTFDLTVTVK
jgi:predicted secreted protein